MGYQESIISVDCLAQAVGIREAVEEYGKKYLVNYYGTERAIKDIYLGTPWYAEEEPLPGAYPDFRAGSLFVVVGGQRHPIQDTPGMIWIDGIIGLRDVPFRDFFENVSQEEIDAAVANGCRGAVTWARRKMSDLFEERLELDRIVRETYESRTITVVPEDGPFTEPVPEPQLLNAASEMPFCEDFEWNEEDERQWREQQERWEEQERRRREERERMAAITPADVEQKVRELLSNGGESVRVREVATSLGLTEGMARSRMEKLVSAGSLVKRHLDKGRVAYALTVPDV